MAEEMAASVALLGSRPGGIWALICCSSLSMVVTSANTVTVMVFSLNVIECSSISFQG